MKYPKRREWTLKSGSVVIPFFVATLFLMMAAPAFAGQGWKNECKLLGSWLGYSSISGDAWWMSTVSGQNAARGTLVLSVPGYDVTLAVNDIPTFPDAVLMTDLKGVWTKMGDNSFAYTVVGIAIDSDGGTQYLGKLTGTETLSENCDSMFLEHTALQIYLPDADPFEDDSIIGPLPFPDHYGYRMKVDLP